MAVETLTGAPSLLPLYARAALTARGRGGSLPDRSLRVDGVVLDRDRLARYQRLCGFSVGDVLPHTYPHVLGFPLQMALMARRDFPLALPGLVHTENRITVHRELHSGERLDVGVHAERLREHPKGLLVDLVTEVTVEGERVWDGRSTYLRRTVPHAGDLPPAPSPRAAEPPPGPALPVGDPAAVWRLGEGLGRAYARVSGDVNPIHLHALTARPLGFRRAIAHGMWTTARTLAVLGPRTGARSASHAWFRRPVLLPSTVELVLDTAGPQTVAGLRSARDPAVEHLALTWA